MVQIFRDRPRIRARQHKRRVESMRKLSDSAIVKVLVRIGLPKAIQIGFRLDERLWNKKVRFSRFWSSSAFGRTVDIQLSISQGLWPRDTIQK